MSTTIIQRTISAALQEAISFSDSAFARSIAIPAGWSSIRIGARLHFTQGVFTTPVYWAFGLCHGTAKLVNSNTTDNFAGVISDSGFSSNGNTPGSVYFNVNLRPFTRVGNAFTFGTNITADSRYGNTAEQSSADRSLLFVDITKGSPNYTMNAWFAQTGTAHDFSEANFQTMLADFNSPSFGGGQSLTHGTNQTIAVDEVANGAFDAMSIWWNQTGVTLEVCDIGWAVMS